MPTNLVLKKKTLIEANKRENLEFVWMCVSVLDVCATMHHQYNDVNNQQDATTFSFINLFKSALHVSDNKFAHPQEQFLTVYTAFGTMH